MSANHILPHNDQSPQTTQPNLRSPSILATYALAVRQWYDAGNTWPPVAARRDAYRALVAEHGPAAVLERQGAVWAALDGVEGEGGER